MMSCTRLNSHECHRLSCAGKAAAGLKSESRNPCWHHCSLQPRSAPVIASPSGIRSWRFSMILQIGICVKVLRFFSFPSEIQKICPGAVPPGRCSRHSASARPWPRHRQAPRPHLTDVHIVKSLSKKGNYGKPMENLWKTYGKPMENPWKTHGKPMENLWKAYYLWQNMTEDMGVEKRLHSSFLQNKQFKSPSQISMVRSQVTSQDTWCSHDTGIFEGILDGTTDLILGMGDEFSKGQTVDKFDKPYSTCPAVHPKISQGTVETVIMSST